MGVYLTKKNDNHLFFQNPSLNPVLTVVKLVKDSLLKDGMEQKYTQATVHDSTRPQKLL